MKLTPLLFGIAIVSLGAAPALGGGLVPVNPIMNPGFEIQSGTVLGTGGFADGAVYWSEGYGSNAAFYDFTGDGDLEAVFAPTTTSMHNLWQATLPPLQVISANFDAFEFTLEAGAISRHAGNQIGLALTPSFELHPWAGNYWEGAVAFPASKMVPDASGRVRLDPVADGHIVCSDWDPCRAFKAAFDAADAAGKAKLLGQARVIQVSFWNFNLGTAAPVVIDDVAIVGATTVAEEIAAGNVNLPN